MGRGRRALLTVPGFCFIRNTELRLSGGVIDPTGCVELFGNSAGVFRDYYFMYTIYFPFM